MTTLHEWQHPLLGPGQNIAGIVLELQRRKGGDEGAAGSLVPSPTQPPFLDEPVKMDQSDWDKMVRYFHRQDRPEFSRLVQRARDGSEKE
jgi:hypothetical protein